MRSAVGSQRQFLTFSNLILITLIFAALLAEPEFLSCRRGAFAKIREFSYFTLDVPSGWKVATKGASVRVRKADKSASTTITFDLKNGRSLKSIAGEASRQAKGTKPEKDEDGDYTFTCNGGRTQAFLSDAGDYFLMMSVTSTPETEDELEAILDSFEMKDMDGGYGDDEDSGYGYGYENEEQDENDAPSGYT